MLKSSASFILIFYVGLRRLGSNNFLNSSYKEKQSVWPMFPDYLSVCYGYDYRKHPNNNNKICSLPSSSCFQQHFHDWFYVLRYNSDLQKLEWALLLFNFNYIHDLTNRRRLYSVPVAEHASFSHQARSLKTNLQGVISNLSKY